MSQARHKVDLALASAVLSRGSPLVPPPVRRSNVSFQRIQRARNVGAAGGALELSGRGVTLHAGKGQQG